MSHLPDEVLARRAVSGKIECFEELLLRYRIRVYRLCYRMSGNGEDAEDWTQECFVRVYQNLNGYSSERPFVPWLLRVVSNTCINLAKSRTRRESRITVGLDSREELASESGDPMDIVISTSENQEIQDALSTLSPIVRQTLILWAQEDLTFRELGEALGVPLPTVSARVHRALAQLREQLQPNKKRVKP